MNNKLIVANWKSHKTIEEGALWIEDFTKHISSTDLSGKTVVLCPTFQALATYVPLISSLQPPILLGAQDVSAFEEGAYTGEVSARQLQELVNYVIIGHSERRTYMHETDVDIAHKIVMAKKYELTTIVCIQSEHTPVAHDTDIIAYEPPAAIGTGHAATLADVESVAEKIRVKYPDAKFLYGGSVSEENIAKFMKSSLIDGLLVGTASLDAKQFATLLQQW
jgi:triosephosphate isomerase (TIM)